MTAQLLPFPRTPPAPAPQSVRSDCERLMRRIVQSKCAYDFEMRQLADLLDAVVERMERHEHK